jgi:hypothetical protein
MAFSKVSLAALALILASFVLAPTRAMMNDARNRNLDAALALRVGLAQPFAPPSFMMNMEQDPWMRSTLPFGGAMRSVERVSYDRERERRVGTWSYDSHTKTDEDSLPLFTLPKESHERELAILSAICALVLIVNFVRA